MYPKELEFSYGYAISMRPYFELKDGKITGHLPFPTFEPLNIQPTEEQWIKFWKTMDEIDIWNWKEHYEPIDIDFLDGIQWRIKIARDNRKIESRGSNAYPALNADGVSIKLTPTFKKFFKAFQELTGVDVLRESNKGF